MILPHPAGPSRSLTLALPVALVALILSVLSINAAGPIKLGLTPIGVGGSNFIVTMQPGESRDLVVEVANYGAEPVRARTFAADAYSMVNGGFGVRLDGEPSSGTTGWLNYPAADIDLAPGAAIERNFTVAVPAAAQPGEYLTTVVLQNADPTFGDASGQSGMVLKQIMRQVVAVSVNVPGPRTPALELGPITHRTVVDRSNVVVAVHNLGNVRLMPAGEFLLWDSAGTEVTRFPITMDTVYAHTDTYVEVPFSEKLNPGDYTAELNLSDKSGVSATSSKLPLTIPEALPDTTPRSTDAIPSLAQATQTPPGPSMTPWRVAMIAFGAGMGLMLTAVAVGFAIYSRRRRNV